MPSGAVQLVTRQARGGPLYVPQEFLTVFQTSFLYVPQPPE